MHFAAPVMPRSFSKLLSDVYENEFSRFVQARSEDGWTLSSTKDGLEIYLRPVRPAFAVLMHAFDNTTDGRDVAERDTGPGHRPRAGTRDPQHHHGQSQQAQVGQAVQGGARP